MVGAKNVPDIGYALERYEGERGVCIAMMDEKPRNAVLTVQIMQHYTKVGQF